MRRYILLLLVLLGVSGLAWALQTAAEEALPAADGPVLIPDRAEITVHKEKGAQLTYTVQNADPRTGTVTWISSDTFIVTVKNGIVTGRSAGTATVTCSIYWPDGTSASADFTVQVLTSVRRIRAEAEKLTLLTDQPAAQIQYSVEPADASCRSVHWVSSDSTVASVDGNGAVTALKPGKAVITLISDDDPAVKTSVTVTVLRPVTSIELPTSYLELAKGKTLRLTADVQPETASYKAVDWESSDRSVAQIKDGVLIAKKKGIAVIRCIAADGSGTEASFTVEVYDPVTRVKVAPTQLKVFLGRGGVQLHVTVMPEEAKYPEVVWTSSDESVATVDEHGVVTPLAPGKVTVTVASADVPSKKSDTAITVLRPVESITFDAESGEVAKGRAVRLSATVLPRNASNRYLTWTSSAPDVASVQGGTVNAKKTGTAIITATASDGSGVSASYTLTVTQAVTGISFPKAQTGVTVGRTVTLPVTVAPPDATDKRLSWISDDPGIASVDKDTGEVTGVSVGSCTLTATALDGSGKTASVAVAVEPAVPVEAVSFVRSGSNGGLYQFELTFRSLTKVMGIRAVGYTLEYSYGGRTYERELMFTAFPFPAGVSKKTGQQEIGYQLTFAEDYKVYLTSVQFYDESWIYFGEKVLIGQFS